MDFCILSFFKYINYYENQFFFFHFTWEKHLFIYYQVLVILYIRIDIKNLFFGLTRLIKNPELHQHTKHIEVKYFFMRDVKEHGKITVKYVDTVNQFADVETKVQNQNYPKSNITTSVVSSNHSTTEAL